MDQKKGLRNEVAVVVSKRIEGETKDAERLDRGEVVPLLPVVFPWSLPRIVVGVFPAPQRAPVLARDDRHQHQQRSAAC